MFTSDIVFSSMPGGAPVVRRAPPSVVEHDGAGAAPATAASERPTIEAPPLTPTLSTLLEKILDMVASISAEKGRTIGLAALEEYARNSGDAGTRRLAENARSAALTKETLIEEMRSGDWLATGWRADSAANVAMVEAIRNGSATVIDLEETGIRSRGSYTTHFTETGVYAGGTSEIDADFDAISQFQDRTFVRHDDGTMTDRASGRNANFVQDGHKFLYVTWP